MLCRFLYMVSTVAYQTQVSSSLTPPLPPFSHAFPPSYAAPPNSHIQKQIIPEYIGIEMLFSLQVFIRYIRKEKVSFINPPSQNNFKQMLNRRYFNTWW